ncbi:precorrin-6A reductase [Clostridium tagluense]|uniref:precorrin-6A reductase n=1 Tax=Clostridium tagluense TaxID=360422 RepID=UPI001C0D1015|nr:precorrin-6A reductase [Clostridium tagluense]MBU3129730.1 precorrin-6A reductase [Clostridium tagluense]MBW9157335.1 precorrin-6A reductase [Clostridium tagluense]MCB2310859.1 precorrin-6A reductase [Clostridium tagluense]MCB2315713.1 precorrin-6A reductase [Clostridium tagluense]MCB2320643.1 precorrin-6A reductase [Clostridium tagluense]
MIWIIGGTTESTILISKIKGLLKYIISVATYSGSEVIDDEHENVVVSRMNYEEMLEFIKIKHVETVIDMSHPYAIEVSENARLACEKVKIKYLRFVRKKTEFENVVYVNTISECIEFLKGVQGHILFTTGIKNIKDFEKVKDKQRFIYRVLPTIFSIQECVNNNIKMKDIIGMLGPFSEELNISLFKEYNADYVVMKDSGSVGGTPEKIEACFKCGITPIVIGRGFEDGIDDMDKLLTMIL